ncbi:DUF1648 domain-containing protein [Nocardioides campestrisoli]|uniref:DUF1648 domain-containing protein n=2 Tax=Nocardioides campestrisoli TaxID=2736757 RepID=UPI00163D4D4F|nr:DUF1648 domain-containing protein [Nocardioides campestrisoli]
MTTAAPDDPSQPPPPRTLEVIAWVLLAAGAMVLLLRYGDLGEVPTHFGASGEPDDWGPRWALLVLLALWVGLLAGTTLLARRPQWHSYPREVTDQNRAVLHLESSRMMSWTGVGLSTVFLGIVLGATSSASASPSQSTGLAISCAGLVLVLAAPVVGIVRMLRVG